MSESYVITKGPLFDGRAAHIINEFTEEARRRIGEEGARDVQSTLDVVLRHPTGHYRSNITFRDPRITDSGVVYGPWLEGVSSRNNSTRFKGYSTFRKVRQRLQEKAGHIAERALPPYLRRLNG